jgi:HD-like signal output (HDOD) protein
MTPSYLTAINSQMESLPALPATVAEVMAVTANPESSADDLMHVILKDQTMCSTILKVANSAFFGIPRGVSTIERAVVVLGYEEIRNIVIGKAIFSSFPQLNQENKNTVNLFWEHAFTCGLAAKIMGDHLHLPPSELFIAGLIHDIGKLVMLMAFPNDYPILQELYNPCNLDNSAEERAKFSIAHDKVGLQLAERWLLPEQLCMAIGFHHSPQHAPRFKQYPLIVQIADILSLMYCSQDFYGPQDVIKFFEDFFPDIGALWGENDLTWNIEKIGIWFEGLAERYERDQAILDIFTSS